jgi:hypothetical protein
MSCWVSLISSENPCGHRAPKLPASSTSVSITRRSTDWGQSAESLGEVGKFVLGYARAAPAREPLPVDDENGFLRVGQLPPVATMGNVGGSRQPGNKTPETRLAGWGTWIRTKVNGVRVRCSTVELSPTRSPPIRFWRI